MPITPDTKNWTWVLERPCAECGFVADAFAREEIGRMLRENAATWQRILARPGVDVRPNDEMWSPLEYGCHIRDVYRVMTGRLELMLTQDHPMFPNWDQDKTAIDDNYAAQDCELVAAELADAAVPFSGQFDVLTPEQWLRTGNRSDGSAFTVESLARYALHDVIHHLIDVPPA